MAVRTQTPAVLGVILCGLMSGAARAELIRFDVILDQPPRPVKAEVVIDDTAIDDLVIGGFLPMNHPSVQSVRLVVGDQVFNIEKTRFIAFEGLHLDAHGNVIGFANKSPGDHYVMLSAGQAGPVLKLGSIFTDWHWTLDDPDTRQRVDATGSYRIERAAR